jgi:hypothetical protein
MDKRREVIKGEFRNSPKTAAGADESSATRDSHAVTASGGQST